MAGQGGAARFRQRARELLVKALYQWQMTGHDLDELTRQFSELSEFGRVDQAYFRELLAIVLEDAPALDQLIGRNAARPVEQLDAVGRAILLLAFAELGRRSDVPAKVIINEAIDLAKRYGAADSYRFVNAVLDKTLKQMSEQWGRSAESPHEPV